MQLGGFGDQFACSRVGADPEIIVSGEVQARLTFLSSFTYFLQSDHSRATNVAAFCKRDTDFEDIPVEFFPE